VRPRRIVLWLILVAVIATPVVLAELALRQMGLGKPIRYGTNAAFRYAPLPNQQAKRWGAGVSVDTHGLRGTEPWSTPADLHVLFIGDSVTWGGTHLDDAAIFSSLACAKLEAHLALRVVCGNAGVNNYGTDNMRARLRYDRAIVDRADVVVVTFVAEDTRRGLSDLESRYFYSSTPPPPLAAIGEALGFLLYKASSRIRHHDLRYDDSYDVEVGLRSLDLLVDELAVLRNAGKEVLLVFSPTLRDLEERTPRLNRAVHERLARSEVPTLNLVDAVKDLIDSQDLRAADLYQDGVHLTAAGHGFYGGWIGATLITQLARAPALVRN
jgi:lysophospholipase L1-like esterase